MSFNIEGPRGIKRAALTQTSESGEELYERAVKLLQTMPKNWTVDSYQLLLKAAELNHPDALYNLGYFTQYGLNGIKANAELAFQYYKRSAELENEAAIYAVGVEHARGVLIKQSHEEAIDHFAKASSISFSKPNLETSLQELSIDKQKLL